MDLACCRRRNAGIAIGGDDERTVPAMQAIWRSSIAFSLPAPSGGKSRTCTVLGKGRFGRCLSSTIADWNDY